MSNGQNEIDWVARFPLWLMVNHGISGVSGNVVIQTSRLYRLIKTEKQITALGTIVAFEFQDVKTKTTYRVPWDRLSFDVMHRNFFPCLLTWHEELQVVG